MSKSYDDAIPIYHAGQKVQLGDTGMFGVIKGIKQGGPPEKWWYKVFGTDEKEWKGWIKQSGLKPV